MRRLHGLKAFQTVSPVYGMRSHALLDQATLWHVVGQATEWGAFELHLCFQQRTEHSSLAAWNHCNRSMKDCNQCRPVPGAAAAGSGGAAS